MMEKLKTGIILDDFLIEAWKYGILHEICTSDYAHISLVLMNICKNENINKLKNRNDSFLISLLQKLTNQSLKKFKPYNSIIDSYNLLKEVPIVIINKTVERKEGHLCDSDLLELQKVKPDIIINLGIDDILKDYSNLSKYGVWSIETDNRLINNEITSSYWKLFNNSPVIGSNLEVHHSAGEGKKIISSSYESVLPFSQETNRNVIFWRASLFIPRVMEGIYKNGEDYLSCLFARFERNRSDDESFLPFNQASYRGLRNFLSFITILSRQIGKKVLHGNEEDWKLLFSVNDNDIITSSFRQFKELPSPKNIFWADPFVISHNDRFYVFVEEIITNIEKAHITVLELGRNGNLLSSKKIIERPYHMSYPFVFEFNNTYYMIPETSENRTIDLYKCTSFPYEWEFDRTIMDNVNAVDATVFHYSGKWWLFTSIDKTDSVSGYNTELFLFFSTDFFSGKWESHPLNPIISDVRTARPAGKIFIQEGKIYRPSQDCSGRYGKAFNINQILTLTETDYEEVQVRKVEPNWNRNLKGTHTFNSAGGLTIIDAYTYRRRVLSSH